jgi:hypothetical protein
MRKIESREPRVERNREKGIYAVLLKSDFFPYSFHFYQPHTVKVGAFDFFYHRTFNNEPPHLM